jgi:integrase
VTSGHIEKYYETRCKETKRSTVYLEIQALKSFFKGISDNVISIYHSPFDDMPEKMKQKLNKSGKSGGVKDVLHIREVKVLLLWLKSDDSLMGLENYAMVLMLLTSGLRAFELLQLRWKDIEEIEGENGPEYFARFTGKGDVAARQPLYGAAVDATRKYFKKAFKRSPQGDDFLYYTVPRFPGEVVRPLEYHALYDRLKNIGVEARKAGILNRNIVFSPHLMRRSYATTILYKSGMGIKAIQEATRHSSFEVLWKYYINDAESPVPFIAKALA